MAMKSVFIIILGGSILAGCASTDVYLRPERTTYIPRHSDMKIQIDATHKIHMQCLEWDGNKPETSQKIPCLYYSIDENAVFDTFSNIGTPQKTGEIEAQQEAQALRNRYMSFLINISDQNCSTFLNRAFANKSGFDTSKAITQDILTGTSAATANAVPHLAAGLGLANLVIGKSVDNINTTFYFEKTFQALAAAIKVARNEVMTEYILAQKDSNYASYTIYDALANIRRYDDACSIRIGLAKLQALAQDIKNQTDMSEKKIGELNKQITINKKTEQSLSEIVSSLTGIVSRGAESDAALKAAYEKIKSRATEPEKKEISAIFTARQGDEKKLNELNLTFQKLNTKDLSVPNGEGQPPAAPVVPVGAPPQAQ